MVRCQRATCVLVALALAWACDDADAPDDDEQARDAAMDAAADRDAMATTSTPGAPTGGAGGTGGTQPLPASGGTGGSTSPSAPICFLSVAASCDGHEDCAPGQVCCGDFDSTTFSYTRIGCSHQCDPTMGQYRLCHPGDTCDTEGRVCRRSQIIPYSSFSVCAAPAMVSGLETGEVLEGRVLCGDNPCAAGHSCCLRARFDPATSTSTALPPYCVETQAECSCDGPPTADPEADAG